MEVQTSPISSLPEHTPSPYSTANALSSSPPSLDGDVTLPIYRAVRHLPYELREHCMIYLEEGLYCQAINLYISLLTSGNTSSPPLPAFLPPAQHLALIATLAVHPTLTTRAKSIDQIKAASLSLQYLRLILKHVGPIQGRLDDAFTFTNIGVSSRRGVSRRRRTEIEGVTPIVDDLDAVDSELANAGSLWAQAEDFWHIVGWAFNCSILHRRRWERWSAWLRFMMDALEADWEARAVETAESRGKSLIIKYIESRDRAAGKERIILRAVFADGRQKSVGEFGEIWRNETKELKKSSEVKKAEAKIDIEAGDYGDYMDEENDEDFADSDESTSSPLGQSAQSSDSIPNVASPLGGMEAIHLRLRLVSILSKVAKTLPEAFTDLRTLYDTFLEHMRPLPLPTFFLIISPQTLTPLTLAAASSLTQYILRSLIAVSAPIPPHDDINQEILETSYVPYPANTNSMIDNTKVSLCVETLLRLLDSHVGLEGTPGFQEAVEKGILARKRKAKKKRVKRGTDGDGTVNGEWLEGSAERIRGLARMARAQREEDSEGFEGVE